MMGFDVSFDVTKASKNPTIVEATFFWQTDLPQWKRIINNQKENFIKNKILQPTSLGIFCIHCFIFLLNGNGFFVEKNTDPVDDPDDPVVVDPVGYRQSGISRHSAGLNAWDALPVSEKKTKSRHGMMIFYNQSVGQDLEEGCKANGFPFEYFAQKIAVDKRFDGGIFC